jgi:hypothetical protein
MCNYVRAPASSATAVASTGTLVAWGWYASRLGSVAAGEAFFIGQKSFSRSIIRAQQYVKNSIFRGG